jgi:predicted membrane metal-binding protein
MQAGLALPMAYYFHRATTIGLPANLIVVPLTQWIMPAAVLTLALGYVSLWLAKLPVLIATVARSTESLGPFKVWVDSTWLTSGSGCLPPS